MRVTPVHSVPANDLPIYMTMPAARILLIDDDPRITTALGLRLKAAGYEIAHALNGPAGLESAICLQPDLIILDIEMPGLDGLTVAGRLRESAATAEIPIIILSGRIPEIARDTPFGVDGLFYLSKPFESETVLRAVQSMLKRSCAVSSPGECHDAHSTQGTGG